MPNIRISQLETAAQIQGTDYLVVDDTSTTKRATFETLFNSNIAKEFKGSTITLNDYGIRSNDIILKGDLTSSPSNVINVFTAVFVTTVAGFNINQDIIGDDSQKTGTIKSIDSVNKILYIKEKSDTANLDFIVGERFGQVEIVRVEDFKKTLQTNQTLKIFYATSNNGSNAINIPAAPLATGIVNSTNVNAPKLRYTYNIAQFRYDNGKISDTSSQSVTCENIYPELLNGANYNRLSFRRSSSQYGVLVYRQLDNTTEILESMKLVAVLGQRELGSAITDLAYDDLGGFTTPTWVEDIKSEVNGYINSIYYFPISASEIAGNSRFKDVGGFTTNRITSISGRNTINLNGSIYSSNILDIFINNATFTDNQNKLVGGFNKIAEDFSNDVISKITIPAGTYYTSSVTIPSNFFLEGDSKGLSIIKSIPWNFTDVNGNSVFKCVNADRVYIKNLTIDGNYSNNAGNALFSNNFLINGENTKFLTLENLNIKNSTGGGIYAPKSANLRLISNDINNGSLDLRNQNYTGLYAPDSSEFILNTNNIEDWVGPVDVSVSRIGIAANNIIKNCGSGLLVYGSTNLTVTPNIIVGQDGERLPIVDLNDDNFDSINVTLEESDIYTSDIISYLRDGAPAWLSPSEKTITVGSTVTSIPGTGAKISTQVKVLVKLNNQEYLLPSNVIDYSKYNTNIPTISVVSSNDDLKEGLVQFKLTSPAVDSLPNYGELLNVYQYLARPTGEQLVGLVYKIIANEYLFVEGADKIFINSYTFRNTLERGPEIELSIHPDYAYLLPALSVNDTIFPINVSKGSSLFNQIDLLVTKITGTINPIITCKVPSGIIQDTLNNSIATTGGYIGIKNNFVISKGRINKS